ncbi:hypothetical protein [Natrialba sp. SSL1]|nr:hypothetical protein [Natrialba sp. SSL1]
MSEVASLERRGLREEPTFEHRYSSTRDGTQCATRDDTVVTVHGIGHTDN